MHIPPPLLAADWLQAIGPLLFVVFWVLHQVITAMRDAKEMPQEELEPVDLDDEPWMEGQAEALDDRPVVANAGQGDPVKSEVEDFLRRIGKLQEGQQGAGLEGEAAREKPQLDPMLEPPPRRRRPQRGPIRQVEVLTDEPAVEMQVEPAPPLRAEPVAEHRLPESQLAEKASHLGERIAKADDRVEARLHEKFDHNLGRLEERPTKEDAPMEPAPVGSAGRIKQALSTPAGMRDAILLQEILNRPTNRW